ncbi:MAG: glucose-1-phosphate cytidylyltransferase [Betaproteobacteria bacterium]|nr:glucose-1-phosphate cytidylyltransferase [Betaproteobacteria bacterium]
MKAVILAGGIGSRLTEETVARPKPMVEIGGKPILWHIMKIYLAHGISEFIICLGYRGYMIKEYFANYFLHMSDVTFDMTNNKMEVHQASAEPWKVTLVDTGDTTQTGGRLARVKPYLGDDDFCFTYGDGLGNIDIGKLLAFHRQKGRLATVTATQPPGRFGALKLDGERVMSFAEKPEGDGWVNGGFFVLSRKVVDYIDGDQVAFEREPLERLTSENQLSAYHHRGFWQPMDTLREKNLLESLWESGSAPWKVW